MTGSTRIAVFDGSIAVQPTTGGAPTIVGLGGNTDFVAQETDGEVVAIPAATPDLQQLINTIINQVTAADLAALPDPALAVQLQQQQAAAGQTVSAPVVDGQGGALVDAIGNAQAATTEAERQAALLRLVESIIAVDPTFFDDTTIVSVSPN